MLGERSDHVLISRCLVLLPTVSAAPLCASVLPTVSGSLLSTSLQLDVGAAPLYVFQCCSPSVAAYVVCGSVGVPRSSVAHSSCLIAYGFLGVGKAHLLLSCKGRSITLFLGLCREAQVVTGVAL